MKILKKYEKSIYLGIAVLVLLISISAVSYALWTTKFTQTGQNDINVGCLDIQFTEGDSINITNGYPIDDEAGKKSKGTEFSITNTCTVPVAYEVVLDEITTSLADSNLKINVSGSREIEPKLLNEMSNTNPVPLSDQEVSSAKSILKDVVPAAEASGQTGGKKTYVLRLWIKGDISTALESDQTFKGRIAIRANQTNKNDKTLVNNIIANNPIQTSVDFTKGCPNDSESCTSGLFKAEDDQGESYYFRGAVENNYVKFADIVWRIVRINGDGSIRLILKDKIDNNSKFNDYTVQNDVHAGKYMGYTYDNTNGKECTQSHPCEVTYDSNSNSFSNEKFGGTNSDIKTALETWYKSNLNNVNEKITQGYFCNDVSYGSGDEGATTSGYLYYGAYNRINIKQPSLKCPEPAKQDGSLRDYGGIYKTKIGLITADEMNMAGLSLSGSDQPADKTNYLYQNDWWWSFSPYYSFYIAGVFEGHYDYFGYGHTNYTGAVVPVINLSADTLITTGDGSTEHPFEVN